MSDVEKRLGQIQELIAEGLRHWRYQSSAGAADTIMSHEQIRAAQDTLLMEAEHMVRDLRGEAMAATLVCTEHVRVNANYDTEPRTRSVDVTIFFPKNAVPVNRDYASSWTVADPLLVRASPNAQEAHGGDRG